MDEVQSWWEVPCIAHFCSLFRTSFDLPDFDIEELEAALLTDSVEEVGSGLLQDLIVRLLKGSFNVQQDEITTSNYQMFLRRLFRAKCEVDVTRKNPFDSDVAFFSLPLRTKVEILNDLCDFRLDADDITELLKSIEAESLRVEPLGQDSGGSTYWYFYGTRLYREDYHTIHKSPPKKRGRKIEERIVSKWQVVCFTEEDWHLLTSKFKNCKHKDEKNLYTTLREDFLPELSRLFAEKERVMRKRMMDKQLRRSRKDSSPPPQLPEDDTDLKKQRLEQEEADRRLAEEIQRQERAAGRDLRERRGNHSISSSQSVNSPKPSPRHRGKEDSSGGSGRMTNNSMSALLAGKEGDDDDEEEDEDAEEEEDKQNSEPEEEEPKKKIPKAKVKEKKSQPTSKTGSSKTKVKSSIIFSATEEDIQIGMHKVIEYIKGHRDAWPFIGPVDEDYAPNYYKVIRQPMDLQTIEDKLDNHEYLTLDQFRSDFQLVVLNCHKYNGDSSEYTEMVDSLEKIFHKSITRFILPDESDEEISIEYAATQDKKKSRLSQYKPSEDNLLPRQDITPPIPTLQKVKVIQEIVSSPSSPRKKRKKKKNKNLTEKESMRSDMENSEEERPMKNKRLKEAHHRQPKEFDKEKFKERPNRKEMDPKDRPVKKRPRELTPPESLVSKRTLVERTLVKERDSSPSSKHQHHRHHHHHKHSKSHERKEKEKVIEHQQLRKHLPPWIARAKVDCLKEDRRTSLPPVAHNIPHPTPVVTNQSRKIESKPKVKKFPAGGSTLMGFKTPNHLNMKRLQVGKATKFKINSKSPTIHEEKPKEITNSSGGSGNNNGKGDETQEKKRCLLLNVNSSQRLSFGTVLPKHALPLRDFKANRSDDEELGESEPFPRNPTQEEILERLEKTFGASLARTTKDQLAKVILAPEIPVEQIKTPPKEEEEENPSRLELSKGFNREKSLPNLSAWFKAFGAPKLNSPTGTPEKEADVPTTPKPAKFSLMGRSVGDSTPKNTPSKGQTISRPTLQTTPVTKEDPEEQAPLPPPHPATKDEPEAQSNRERRMSTSSLSSQSEVGSPTVFPPAGNETPGAPRWVENRTEAWISGSPSASSQVSSQSPAGPNSPFSPPINSPPTPQTPPRPTAPVRVGFYQDYSVHQPSPEKTTELNVSSPATPPPSNYNARNYHTSYGSSPSPSHMKQDESPVQSPQYAPIRTPNYDSGRVSKEPPPPQPQTQPPPNYGLFPEAAHSASARYSLSTPTPSHVNAEPQAAHQYSRESPVYSHTRVGVNGQQHYGNPAYAHTPPPRPMNLYNPANERFYKSEGLGLSILSTAVSTSTSTVTSSNQGGSGGKGRKEKEPKQQQQQQVEQLAAVNGFQWPHNLASLTQIVNSIPNAMTSYMNAPPHAHAHYPHEAHGYTSLGNNTRPEPPKSESNLNSSPSPAPSGRRSTGSKGNSESKSNTRGGSKSGRGAETPSSNSGMVPGSAFNFSSLGSPELALYSKEMSEYSSNQPTIAHAHHHRSDLYSSPSAAVRGTYSYQLGAFHPSAYQGTNPQNYSQNYSTTPLFQGSPHVMGLLPPTGYPPPYPHPHSLPFPNRPGWI